MGVLITVAELAEKVDRSAPLRLLDVRWKLGGPPGWNEYQAGHIPGAVYVDLDEELAAPGGPGVGRHPLPAVADLQAAARSWGLRDGESVVVYDDNGNLSAARAWWLLRWAGLGDVRLLDGGLSAWRAAGLPVVSGGQPDADPPDADRPDADRPDGDRPDADGREVSRLGVTPGDVTLTGGALPSVGPDGAAALVEAGALLLDARAGERFRGEVASVDPKPGHIPGAVSAPTTENLTPEGTFRSPAELAARFAALGAEPGRPVGVYCGSGVTAAHEIAALAIAGIDDVVLYPGSWSQWATLPDRPVA